MRHDKACGARRVAGNGDDEAHASILDDQRHALVGKGRCQRHEGRTRLHHGEDGDVGLGGTVEQQRDAVAGRDTALGQQVREAVRLRIHLPVAPDPAVIEHGGRGAEGCGQTLEDA